jgi:hypothetical protein
MCFFCVMTIKILILISILVGPLYRQLDNSTENRRRRASTPPSPLKFLFNSDMATHIRTHSCSHCSEIPSFVVVKKTPEIGYDALNF